MFDTVVFWCNYYVTFHKSTCKLYMQPNKPGADVLRTGVLEYMFEVFVLLLGHVLVLVILLNVRRFKSVYSNRSNKLDTHIKFTYTIG